MSQPEENSTIGTAKKILVVDDDAKIRELLFQLLSKVSYQVVTSPTGFAALESLKDDRPDLIIMDERMLGMDGLEILRKIRLFDKEIPIIMLTGHASAELQIAALKLGVNDFLMKGTSTGRFLRVIEEIFDRQKAIALKKKSYKKEGDITGRIMVVDDEVKSRNMLEKFLREENYEVRSVASGEEALTAIKSIGSQPDVILLDLMLPGRDGLVILQEIKKVNKDIAVIMITGAYDEQLRTNAIELGALECLKKPLDLEHLRLTIQIRGFGKNYMTVDANE
ncbi:MAG: response regulator [Planctomycetota bacterium]